jgi:deoxyribonuclease V
VQRAILAYFLAKCIFRLRTFLYHDYNLHMDIVQRHKWQVSTVEAKKIQLELAGEVSRAGNVKAPRFIAGVDISVDRWKGKGTAAVVVLNYPQMEVVEVQKVTGSVTFPYVPGLLSFREMPLILPAFEKLKVTPDLVMMDGQGFAHPRRIGIACHLGLYLGIPTIGCAKSRLVGKYNEPGGEPGRWSVLLDGFDVIGAVVRTKVKVKPVYVSPGHMITLNSAVDWVLACCRGYRLPEPTRLAHMAAGEHLK